MGLRAIRLTVVGEAAVGEVSVIASEPGAAELIARGERVALREGRFHDGCWLFSGESGAMSEQESYEAFAAALPPGFRAWNLSIGARAPVSTATALTERGLADSAIELAAGWSGGPAEAKALDAMDWRSGMAAAASEAFERLDWALDLGEMSAITPESVERELLAWRQMASRKEALELDAQCAPAAKSAGARL